MPGTRKLGRTTAQRTAMLRAMVTFLLENGKIETTLTRAKEVQAMAEKMITDALFWLLLLRKMLQASSLRKLLQNTAIERVAIQELLKSVPVVVTPLKWQLSSSFNSF